MDEIGTRTMGSQAARYAFGSKKLIKFVLLNFSYNLQLYIFCVFSTLDAYMYTLRNMLF